MEALPPIITDILEKTEAEDEPARVAQVGAATVVTPSVPGRARQTRPCGVRLHRRRCVGVAMPGAFRPRATLGGGTKLNRFERVSRFRMWRPRVARGDTRA